MTSNNKHSKKRGRKKWMPTQEQLEQIEAMAQGGMTHQQIYDSLGISHDTFYQRINEISELADIIKRGKSKGITFAVGKLMEQIQSGNTTAIIFYLKCNGYVNMKKLLDDEKPKDDKLLSNDIVKAKLADLLP